MDPALAQQFNLYTEFLDHAEANISAWFKASMLTDPDVPVDHRGLASIVLTLRRVIAMRQTLRDWSQREEQAAQPKSRFMSDEEADRFIKIFMEEHNLSDVPPPDDQTPREGDNVKARSQAEDDESPPHGDAPDDNGAPPRLHPNATSPEPNGIADMGSGSSEAMPLIPIQSQRASPARLPQLSPSPKMRFDKEDALAGR